MKIERRTNFSIYQLAKLAVFGLLLMLHSPALLLAHHDLSSSIQLLTKKISKGATADLYYQRGVEYRAMRKLSEAEKDFQAALKLDRNHSPSLGAQARLFSQSDRHDLAVASAEKLIDLKNPPAHFLLLAEIYHAAGRDAEALATISRAPRDDTSALLLHAYLEPNRLKSAQILKNGFHRTKNIVLRDAWLDTLIAADRGTEALPMIEKEIVDSRFRASWLIRRARIFLSDGKKEAAHKDLRLALSEIQTRLSPSQPDLTLIHDRGLAFILLGKRAAAEKDFQLLQRSSFSPLAYAVLARLIKTQPVPDAEQ